MLYSLAYDSKCAIRNQDSSTFKHVILLEKPLGLFKSQRSFRVECSHHLHYSINTTTKLFLTLTTSPPSHFDAPRLVKMPSFTQERADSILTDTNGRLLSADEVQQMMFVSGETVEPTPETTMLVEQLVQQQVMEMVRPLNCHHLRSKANITLSYEIAPRWLRDEAVEAFPQTT